MATPNLGWENQVENTLQPGVAFNLLADDADAALAGNVVVDFEEDDNLTLGRSQWMTSVLLLIDSGTVLTGSVDVILPAAFPSMLVVNGTAQSLTMTNGLTDSVSIPANGLVRISSGPDGVLSDPAGSGGGGGGTAPVVTESGTSLTATPANSGNYTRFTNSSAKTYTFDDAESYVVGAEYHGRNAGAGTITITEAGTMTVNPPADGTLVIPQGGTFTVKIVAADEADLFGVTEQSS